MAGDSSRSTENLPQRRGDASEPSLSCPRVTEPSWRCSGVAPELPQGHRDDPETVTELPQGPRATLEVLRSRFGAAPELLRSCLRALEPSRSCSGVAPGPWSCPGAVLGDAPEPWSAPQALPSRPEQKVMALGTEICMLVSFLEQCTPSAHLIKGTEEDAGGKSARL